MAREFDTAGKAVSTDTGGAFAPLPAGRYEATIFGVDEGTYAKAKPKSGGLPYLNVQYRISEGQKGANRRVFEMVPMAPQWNDGGDAFRFHQFCAAVTGVTEKTWREAWNASVEDKKAPKPKIPDNKDLLGREVTLTLKIEDDKYHYDIAHKEWEDLPDKERLDTPEPTIADFQRNAISGVGVKGKGNMEAGNTSSKVDVSKAVVLDEFQL